jgi:endonuclease-3 related protein
MNAPLSLQEIFERLLERFGALKWWPAETPFEVCVGAILTQNTAWTNVEKAISALKQAGVMSPETLHGSDPEYLALLIRPAGYFNVKSRRLKDFTAWLFLSHQGSLERMFSGDWHDLRMELLRVRGIGPETADSILLYAGNKPSFVVDAYTRRLFLRLGLLPEAAGYDHTRDLFMNDLPEDVPLFNEYHALIVQQCKRFCRAKPLCSGCPLSDCCPSRRP